jgi:uncharacterized protein (TIGR02757 family)
MKMPFKMPELKSFLDEKVSQYNNISFIPDDPVSVPHMFRQKEDIEIAGFFAALFAWGQRKTAISKAKELMEMMHPSPYAFLLNAQPADFIPMTNFVHRTFNSDDCLTLLHALSFMYKNEGGLEQIVSGGFLKNGASGGILALQKSLLAHPHLQRTGKHLPNPEIGSAAKRINMFLRWMVRKDSHGVDFGLWTKIDPAALICPLDVHSGRAARSLGLITRKQNDWKAVEELTNKLRGFDPNDPVKYDFALFGLSRFEMGRQHS